LLQPLDEAEPGAGKLAELVIKISASRQLARGNDHRDASNRHAVEAGLEIALAAQADHLVGHLTLMKQ
jgi:hypothetical protein